MESLHVMQIVAFSIYVRFFFNLKNWCNFHFISTKWGQCNLIPTKRYSSILHSPRWPFFASKNLTCLWFWHDFWMNPALFCCLIFWTKSMFFAVDTAVWFFLSLSLGVWYDSLHIWLSQTFQFKFFQWSAIT